jgi:hypothetical protein
MKLGPKTRYLWFVRSQGMSGGVGRELTTNLNYLIDPLYWSYVAPTYAYTTRHQVYYGKESTYAYTTRHQVYYGKESISRSSHDDAANLFK